MIDDVISDLAGIRNSLDQIQKLPKREHLLAIITLRDRVEERLEMWKRRRAAWSDFTTNWEITFGKKKDSNEIESKESV